MNKSSLEEELFKLSTNYFHKWYGLLSSLFLVWVLFLGLYKLFPSNDWFKWYSLGIIIICLIIIIWWFIYSFKYPKRSGEKLGVVIAVYVETKEDYKLFKKDFLLPFREKIIDQGLPFDILVLKNHQSENINTTEDAGNVLKKTNAQFIVWGNVKRRDHQLKEHYIFALRAMVVHSPITEVQKVLLVRDFNYLLKNKVIFETGLQYDAFELRASELFWAVNYITGRAALLSGDANIARKLHESLYLVIQNNPQPSINLKNLGKIIAIECSLISDSIFIKNGQKITPDFIENVSTALKYDKDNYPILMKQAIIDFNEGEGDPKKAIQTLNKAKKNASSKEWLYSKIFLHLWLGEYPKALTECDRLSKKSRPNDVEMANQVCQFNKNIIDKFPLKTQLYFWSGFLYYVKANNLSFADTMFQNLVDKGTTNENVLIIRATEYLSKIRQSIGY